MSRRLGALLIALTAGSLLSAQSAVEFKGFADVFYAGGVRTGELLGSKVRFRPEWEGYLGPAAFRATMDAAYDGLVPAKTEVALKEAYIDYGGDFFDLRGGRQIVSWGKADGLEITDLISPKDRTELAGQEYEDTRLPVNALKLRYFRSAYTLEALWIPLFTPAALPREEGNPLRELFYPSWIDGESGPLKAEYTFEEGNRPDELADSEYALRLSFFLPALDFSLSFFRGWEDEPVYQAQTVLSGENAAVTLTPSYHRIWMGGADLALPLGELVLRGEGAWIAGRRFPKKDAAAPAAERAQLKALAGLDWNPGGGWMITAQYAEDILPGGASSLLRDRRETSATLRISKSLLRETLQLSAFSLLQTGAFDSCHSFEAEYALSDELKASLGSTLYLSGPDEKGDFGQVEDLSTLWLRGRYSF